MGTPTKLMTVEEYRQQPEPRDGTYYELHHGELVKVTRPKLKHSKIQRRIVQLMDPLVQSYGVVWAEVAFRPYPEHEVWAADVAVVSTERWQNADNEDNIAGSPDIVIEALSPSNTAFELDERETLCIATGCREFWTINPDRKSVKITRPDGTVSRYEGSSTIPLPLFGNASLNIADIFDI